MDVNKIPITRGGYTEATIKFLASGMTQAKEKLAGVEFDTIVGTGLSGGLVLPGLAEILSVDWAVVRKQDASAHSDAWLEGTHFGKRWLFVDDFISSGATLRRVKARIAGWCDGEYWGLSEKWETEYVGSYLYDPNRYVSAAVEDPRFIGDDDY